jgi:hypothetical protein
MKPLRLLLLAAACAMPALALAQWQWVDKDGRKVFSDRPPPADVPESKILRQPAGRGAGTVAVAPVAAAAPAAAPASARSAAPKLSGKDKELEEKKKQAEAAEAEKRKAEEQKVAAQRAENCERLKRDKATMDSGIRIARANAKGEREILDDNQRAAETRRIESLMARECAPAAQ